MTNQSMTNEPMTNYPMTNDQLFIGIWSLVIESLIIVAAFGLGVKLFAILVFLCYN
jgi:hypothetical protein